MQKEEKREEELKSKSVTNFHVTKANSWRFKLLGSIESFAKDRPSLSPFVSVQVAGYNSRYITHLYPSDCAPVSALQLC